jgi:hypothetical protein
VGADAARDEEESNPCILRIILPFKTLPCKGEKGAKFSFLGKFPCNRLAKAVYPGVVAFEKCIDEHWNGC